MMDWHDGMTGWGWFGMGLGMLLVIGLLVVAGAALFRALDRSPTGPPPSPEGRRTAEETLADRFARGEIDEQDYHARMAALRDTDRSAGPGS
ncbi:SHOCT domain-containing protein [Kitasatospora sp. NPDC059571]|uniref:SHOCT domain-containing protein n=1 Tax=Kitasatospora sp. NPDC059571 TaxID=3346871 RepID=UPI0036A68387